MSLHIFHHQDHQDHQDSAAQSPGPAGAQDPLRPWELAYVAIRAHVTRSAAPGALARLVLPDRADNLVSTPDEAFKALARLILGAGLQWPVLATRWDALRRAMSEFRLQPVAALDEADVQSMLELPGMLRNPAKLWALAENARFLERLLEHHGSLAALRTYLVRLPPEQAFAYLVDALVRVGPVLASRWMHALGIDCHVPHPKARRLLRRLGAIGAGRGAVARQAEAAAVLSRYEPGPMPAATTSAILYAFASGMLLPEAVCGPIPRCALCPAALHCAAWRRRRVDAP